MNILEKQINKDKNEVEKEVSKDIMKEEGNNSGLIKKSLIGSFVNSEYVNIYTLVKFKRKIRTQTRI